MAEFSRNRVCPHLGCRSNPDSFDSYASPRNECGRVVPAQLPARVHQSRYCLSMGFLNCPFTAQRGRDLYRLKPGQMEMSGVGDRVRVQHERVICLG